MTSFAALQDSFNAVTPPGSPTTGSVIDLGVISDAYVLYVTVAGTGADTINIHASVSLDNSTFFNLPSNPFGNMSGGQTISDLGSVPARYVSFTASTTAGSPVVTAAVAPAAGC